MKIDKNKAVKKWSPILENMGINESERIDWMAEYAEMHAITESMATSGVGYANQGNVAGMGNVVSAQPSGLAGQTLNPGFGANGGSVGSGDYGQQLLPVAMKIAGQTIGLDLVAVKPSPGPKIDLMYIDFKYDDTPDESQEKPLIYKVKLEEQADRVFLKNWLLGVMAGNNVTETVGGLNKRLFLNLTGGGETEAGTNGADTILTVEGTVDSSYEGVVEFLGFSRIDGLPMFRSFRQVNVTSSYGYSFVPYLNTFDQADNIRSVMVEGFEGSKSGGVVNGVVSTDATGNLLDGLSGSNGSVGGELTIELISALEDHITGYVSNFEFEGSNGVAPMQRGTDDNSYPGIIAPEVSTKTIAVGTIEISTALKRTEIEDIKANTGMDIVQKMESILVNELSQTISKQIVGKLFEMGDLNRESAPVRATAGIVDGTIFDFDIDDYLDGIAPGGETSHAVQRKLISKILNASNYVATEGRVGPAQFVVTNGNLASALQDVAGYTINPVKSKLNGAGQLYPVGTIGDVTIYVDPYMKYNDNRILVGRKNNPDQPGIVFIPYLMAQSISIISEATFAPRLLLRSRYAIGELGWYPQKQYMTIKVNDPKQILV